MQHSTLDHDGATHEEAPGGRTPASVRIRDLSDDIPELGLRAGDRIYFVGDRAFAIRSLHCHELDPHLEHLAFPARPAEARE